MNRQTNAVVWIVWGGAVALATVSTRNPFYLTLNLLATSVVYLSLPRGDARNGIWGLVIKIGLVVAGMTIAFNLLTAHAGDRVMAHIPANIPIIGGSITANALIYGLSTALAILTLIVTAAVFGSVVDRASLMRTVPTSMSSAGIAAIIGLSFFPQTLISLREVREAQAARGFRVRSIRDVRPLVIPVLSSALEGAFNLAEAMESRAFASERAVDSRPPWLFVAGVVLTLIAVNLLIGGYTIVASFAVAIGISCVIAGLLRSGRARTAYRLTEWRTRDWLLLTSSSAAILIFAAAIVYWSTSIEWSPFPTLDIPTVHPLLGIACILLATPAVTHGAGS